MNASDFKVSLLFGGNSKDGIGGNLPPAPDFFSPMDTVASPMDTLSQMDTSAPPTDTGAEGELSTKCKDPLEGSFLSYFRCILLSSLKPKPTTAVAIS